MRKAKEKDLGLKDPSHEYKVFKASPRKRERLKKRGWEFSGSTRGKLPKNIKPTSPQSQKSQYDDPRKVIGVKRDWAMKKKIEGPGKGSYQNTRTLGGMPYR